VLLALVVALGPVALVSACDLLGADTGSAAATGEPSDGAGASTTTASTTTTTIRVNELLAPPPTVVPELSVEGGLAPQVRRVDTTDRVIFITIDDGLVRDPAVLQRMLDMGLPFTSFLTVPFAEEDPEFWEATEAAWGIIETHTINHPNLREVSEATLRREICEPADTFEEMFGRRPTLFRPPYGNSNDAVRRVAADCGYDAVVLWTGSTNNGQLTMQQVSLQPGDIILMHYRDTLQADLDDVLARAKAEGFTIGRLQDYLSPGR
jgi:peptidoglycan/xylan/chitin deacetylase (PgdA/CDA1 family)